MTNAAIEIARLLIEAELARQGGITNEQRRLLLHLRRRAGRQGWEQARRRAGVTGKDVMSLTRREAERLVEELKRAGGER